MTTTEPLHAVAEPSPEPSPAPVAEPSRWSFATKFLFRFAFVYFVLYCFPSNFDLFEFTTKPTEAINALWDAPVQFTAKLFGLTAAVKPNGSGDTTYNYVQVLVTAVLALAGAIVWSIIDRRRPRYTKAYIFFRAFLRYALAAAMVQYGMAKVIPMQFAPPSLDRLMQPFGDASPMGLLWTFMGASKAYTIFAGAGELLGGLLLIARRTALLGALIVAGVMANVVMLNFAYDVPVKLYSSHLLAMALIIALPDAQRLARFFILQQPVAPAPLPRFTNKRGLEIAGIVVRVLVFASMIVFSAKETLNIIRTTDPAKNRAPLYGIWAVDRASAVGEAAKWTHITSEGKRVLGVMLDGGSRKRYPATYETNFSRLLIRTAPTPLPGSGIPANAPKPKVTAQLTYTLPDANTLVLDGTWDGKPFHALAHRDDHKFLLTTRGFHWVNEYPFNR